MMKLTAELVQDSMQYINPLQERELNLRGFKIQEIENLEATDDRFDTIDFSDNVVQKIDGFPLLPRLKCLFFNNNRIVSIGENLREYIPNLNSLILTGNHLSELSDIDPLAKLEHLTILSLLNNTITEKQHYRLHVIQKLPSLSLLDFREIKLGEKREAKKLFRSRQRKLQRNNKKIAK